MASAKQLEELVIWNLACELRDEIGERILRGVAKLIVYLDSCDPSLDLRPRQPPRPSSAKPTKHRNPPRRTP